MNIFQRIVLIVGALIFAFVIFDTFTEAEQRIGTYPFLAAKALAMGCAVIGATVLIFFALKGLRSKISKDDKS